VLPFVQQLQQSNTTVNDNIVPAYLGSQCTTFHIWVDVLILFVLLFGLMRFRDESDKGTALNFA
jgi:hypothetical protein